MKTDKGIRTRPIFTHSGAGNIAIIGFKSKDARPYLRLEDRNGEYMGVIADRDLKRLMAWVKDCLKVRK